MNRPHTRSWIVTTALGCFLWVLGTVQFWQASGNHATQSNYVDSVSVLPPLLPLQETTTDNDKNHSRGIPRIAIVSSHVAVTPTANNTRISDTYLSHHIVNKACYADLWGYDYIFNTTAGYESDKEYNQTHRSWLQYGHWHRVPALQAVMDRQEHDWIFYTDLDYVIQDLRTPLTSFFKEWELYGHNNVHVLVPNDGDNRYTFSSFAMLLRNSHFGRRLLHHWNRAAFGICPAGNFPPRGDNKYHWEFSDQPGLWYALMKTHAEIIDNNPDWTLPCNITSGYLLSDSKLRDEMNAYFKAKGYTHGVHAGELNTVPADQPILFSKYDTTSPESGRNGLGVQRNWSPLLWKGHSFPRAFGVHIKVPFDRLNGDLPFCVQQRGCFARYKANDDTNHTSDDAPLEIKCNGSAHNMAH